MRKKGLSLFLTLCLLTALLPSPVHAIDIVAPMLTGGSVWRSSDTSAEIRFLTDEDGTCYYQTSDSATPPFDITSSGTEYGAAGTNTVLTLQISTLTATENYIHVIVKDSSENISEPLTITMPGNYCYFENFEVYPVETTAASGSLSPIQQINNGTGDANQKVTSSVDSDPDNTKMLVLDSAPSWASDQVVLLDKTVIGASNAYVLEGEVYPLSEESSQLRLSFTKGSYGASYEAGIYFKNGNIVSISNSERVLQSNYSANQWYSVKLVAVPAQSIYKVYVDDILLDDSLTLPSDIDRIALSAGHSQTAYFDNLQFYTLDSVPSTDGITWDGHSYDFTLLDEESANSENNPYIIDTAGKLAKLAVNVNLGNNYLNQYFRLTQNLDLNNKAWAPIGTESTNFEGYFDGANHTVSNLKIASGANYVGLFSYIGANASIESLTLSQVSITGAAYTGALAAYCYGTITDCEVSGTVIGGFATGGLVGQVYSGFIENCRSYANVTGSSNFTGGLVGYLFSNIGNSSTAVLKCSAEGDISGSEYTGGLIGYIQGCTCRESYSTGNVTGSYRYTGGLVGAIDSANGFVSAVRDCYTLADISAPSTQYVGGFAGANWYGTIENCYAAGTISALNATETGGLTGTIYSGAVTSNSYYDAGISGMSDTGKGEPKSTSAMKAIATFSAWTFPTVWTFSSDNGGYPALAWQGFTHHASSTISPATASFDKYTSAVGYANITITQALNGNTLTAIKNGETALVSGTDYTVSGSTITIKKEYLAVQPVGTTTLTFDYSGGTDPTLAITVSNSSPSASYNLTVNGSYAVSSGTGSYTQGTAVSINAGSRSGYSFAGWTSSSGGSFSDAGLSSTTFTMPESNAVVTAAWIKISGDSIGTSEPADYNVTSGASQTHGGTVNFDKIKASEGNKVTITTLPENGYQLSQINVTDKNGKKIELTDNGDGTYSFKMPSGDVTVTSVFVSSDQSSRELPFEDVHETDWFHGSVEYVFRAGLFNGTSDTQFTPSGETSRGMLVTVLFRLSESNDSADNIFSDVEPGSYYEAAVTWASKNGIVTGYGEGIFGPEDIITREQLATIIWRYNGSPMIDSYEGLYIFTDKDDISEWALQAMIWANQQGIIEGKGNGILDPQGSATRAEAATILQRFIELTAD